MSMFTTLTVLLATAVAANAASSASSAPAATASSAANPYIPSDISTQCSTYLTTLNADTSLSACTSALISASAGYGPGGNVTSASKTDVSSALSSICSASTSSTCSQSLLTGKLAAFYTACGPELTGSSPSAEVKMIYDTFYSLKPFLSAVCATDDSGAYCLLSANATAAASTLTPELATSKPLTRRAGTVTAYMPNATTISTNNILYLFLSADLPKAQLCTTCTRNIVSAYITYETNTNYAPGLAQSVLMSGQTALYAGVVNTCGADFLTSAVKAAGGLGQGSGSGNGTSGALPRAAPAGALAVLAAVAAVFVL
ncbi:hypothetical protein C8R44DRAFT_845419 [Mycena epipterygia]|nr:hypothetical protein C8R44DRAFT_845419 [Mycena epipterygia]